MFLVYYYSRKFQFPDVFHPKLCRTCTYVHVGVCSICRLCWVAGKICESIRQPPYINGFSQHLEEVRPIIIAVVMYAHNAQSIYIIRVLVCTQRTISRHADESLEPNNETSMPKSSKTATAQTGTSTNSNEGAGTSSLSNQEFNLLHKAEVLSMCHKKNARWATC